MRMRISPNMDFFIDMELQGVNEKTRSQDIQEFEKVVFDEFKNRLKKAFPEDDFRIYEFDFNVSRETVTKVA
jgi:hypothetical protein